MPKYEKGDKHPNYKGGMRKDHGYLAIYRPDHPNCTTRGLIKLHRYLYEKYYNCCLLKYTEIHHINDNRLDNRKENLKPLYKGQHSRITNTKDVKRNCLMCNIDRSVDYKGRKNWMEYDNGYICYNCYMRLYRKKQKLFDQRRIKLKT